MAKHDHHLHRPNVDPHLRDLDNDGESDKAQEYALWFAGAVIGLCATFWLAVQVASMLTLHWIPVSQGIAAVPVALFHLREHVMSPKLGYPPALQHMVAPGWLILPVLAGILFGEYKLVQWWRNRNKEKHDDRGGTHWATEKQLELISDLKKNPKLKDGVVLGLSEKGTELRLEPDNHALVVAGTRSGKTAGLCVPALLTFEGVVIATSVKNDLVENTIKQRQKMGEVFVFDPVGAMGLPDDEVAGWTPLDQARTWRGAQRVADALIEIAMSKKGGGGGGNMDFFKQQSKLLLPVLLYSASVMDEDMRRVVRWLHRLNDEQTHSEVHAILEWKENNKAMDIWSGYVSKDGKMRSDIASTIQTAFVSYEDEKVVENAMKCDITPERLFNGGNNTLYVVAPMAEQSRLEPIFVALMQGLLMWVTEQPKKLDSPLLCVLDEAANIAALPELPQILSTIGSQRVSIITAWQDFSQIRARYNNESNTILNNSRGRMILPGVADPETLNYFRDITGETVEENVSVSASGKKSKNISVSEGRRALLSAATIREQELGEAILVYGGLPPAKVKLRMFFKDPLLSALADGRDAAAATARLAAVKMKATAGLAGKIPVIGRFLG